MTRRIAAACLLFIAAPAMSAAPLPRVALETTKGTIVIELDTKRAPITAGNFLKYVDQKKLDGTVFYRAARTKGTAGRGFIQGGIRHSYVRMLPPIAHEPTSKTGIKHLDGTISMARGEPGSATGDFFILAGTQPAMDARPGGKGDTLGYAAFGHVTKGMDVVRKILAAPTVPNAGAGAMKGQMITVPIKIVSAHRAP